VLVRIWHPQSGQSELRVYTRDLSQGGCSFLHTSFKYPGSRCTIVLSRSSVDEPMVVSGVVVNCRYLAQGVHEVGVQFDSKIDLDGFWDDFDAQPIRWEAGSRERRTTRVRRTLCIFNDEEERNLCARHLEITGVGISLCAHCLGAGVDRIKRGRERFDAVVCRADVEGLPSSRIVEVIRCAGFKGVLVLVGAVDPSRPLDEEQLVYVDDPLDAVEALRLDARDAA